MKGLLVKDIRLMMANKSSLILVLAMCVFYGFFYGRTEDGVTFISFMVTFIFSNLAIGTITSDMNDNGMEYLLSFPNAKKMYVYEKYVFVATAVILSFGVSSIVSVIMLPNQISDVLILVVIMTMINVVYAAISMPLFIKYGAEKGRIYLFIIMGALAAIVYGVMSFSDNVYISKALDVINRIGCMDMKILITVGMVVVIVVYEISMLISVKALKKKTY